MSVSSSDPGTGLRGRRREREALDRLLDRARAGHSAVLVVRGEAGIGKTALLEYAAEPGVGASASSGPAGVESEMELAFAGLHQLCAPMLGRLEQLARPAARCAAGRVRVAGAAMRRIGSWSVWRC